MTCDDTGTVSFMITQVLRLSVGGKVTVSTRPMFLDLREMKLQRFHRSVLSGPIHFWECLSAWVAQMASARASFFSASFSRFVSRSSSA